MKSGKKKNNEKIMIRKKNEKIRKKIEKIRKKIEKISKKIEKIRKKMKKKELKKGNLIKIRFENLYQFKEGELCLKLLKHLKLVKHLKHLSHPSLQMIHLLS